MKLTLKRFQIRALWQALKSLDGRVEKQVDSDGKSGFLMIPYTMEMGAKYAIVKTQKLLQGEMEAIEKEQESVQKQMSKTNGDGKPVLSDEEKLALNDRFNEFLREEVEVEVWRTKLENLKADTNKLGPNMLADLSPMFDQAELDKLYPEV